MLELTLQNKAQDVSLATKSSETNLVSTTARERLEALPVERQSVVRDFSQKIDILDNNIVTSYGNVPLKKSADVCGKFLEMTAGTPDDKAVVDMITKLSEATKSGQREIEILAKPPSFFKKLFYLFTGKSQEDEVKLVVKNTYQIITGIKSQMDKSVNTLIERAEQGKNITKSNAETVISLEEYLVAGYLALDEAQKRCEELKKDNNPNNQIAVKQLESAIRQMSYQLSALEQAKASSIISAVQSVTNVENTNTAKQMIQSQVQTIVTIFSQLGANAILNNTTKRIHESQKTMTEMSKAMMLQVSQDTADTTVAIAESFSKGVLDVETILQCMDTMTKGFEEANSYYQKFFENRDAELVKLKEAEEKMMPVLKQAISSSVASKDIFLTSKENKLVV